MPLDPSDIARAQAACDVLAASVSSPAFRSRFPSARLLRSAEVIEAARRELPTTLLPFMSEEQPGSTDVYAFDLQDEQGNRVVVWNDHAVVADWKTFEEFVDWVSRDPSTAA